MLCSYKYAHFPDFSSYSVSALGLACTLCSLTSPLLVSLWPLSPTHPCLALRWRRRWPRREGGQVWQDWTLSSRGDAQMSSNCANRMTWIAHSLTLCRNKITSFRDSPRGHWGSSLFQTEKKKSLDQATGPQRLLLGVVSLGNVGVPPPLRPTASETGGGPPHTTHLYLSKPHRSFRCCSRVWKPLNHFLVWITLNYHLWINI